MDNQQKIFKALSGKHIAAGFAGLTFGLLSVTAQAVSGRFSLCFSSLVLARCDVSYGAVAVAYYQSGRTTCTQNIDGTN